jgi:hypothetical protein
MKVCKDWFPETEGFMMDDRLAMQLEVLLKNIKNDWDFTIIVTGQGEVRVGKSVLAMQIAAYWAYEIQKRYGIVIPFNVKDNFVFDGSKLIEQGNKLGVEHPYSPLIFDEAGADLEGRKSMQTQTQDVLDYFRECGQYNMLNILVLPEYFDLPKGIALSRSIFLIDVFYQADEDAMFKRGFFNFYSRRSKKNLYLNGKKTLNYSCTKSDFGMIPGRFGPFYSIDKEEYKAAKKNALKMRESKVKDKAIMQRNALLYVLQSEHGYTNKRLAERINNLTGRYCAEETVRDAIGSYYAHQKK